tara:strand:+ start:258 stop:620 length:363 start_codon:yes stop_codon:yes gene_type:complete
MDYNEIAKYEKAIKEKYGNEAIQNPKKNWDEEKENKYLEELKTFYKGSSRKKKTEKSEGFEVVDKKLKSKTERTCPVCGVYSMTSRDDLYMNKFQCCWDCYIQYVEGREERWKTGWRPER